MQFVAARLQVEDYAAWHHAFASGGAIEPGARVLPHPDDPNDVVVVCHAERLQRTLGQGASKIVQWLYY